MIIMININKKTILIIFLYEIIYSINMIVLYGNMCTTISRKYNVQLY